MPKTRSSAGDSPGSDALRPVLPAGGPSITWLGHATAVADLGASRVIFDPLLPWRARAAGQVEAILITHSHVDHLNRWSLKAIDRDTHLIVPMGCKSIVSDLGFRQVSEVTAGDQIAVGDLEIEAVQTKHDNGRWRKGDKPECVGYAVKGGNVRVHHAGDVDFSDHAVFDDIGKKYAIDATLLPIGGMMPVWYYRSRRRHTDRGIHIDPDCALDIYERMGAKNMIPVHWGTLHLRLGLPSMPMRRLAKIVNERNSAGVRILMHGEKLDLAPQAASEHVVKQ